MPLNTLLQNKITNPNHRQSISGHAARFSPDEQQLLREILQTFTFDDSQAQALAYAVQQQSRFDPAAAHQHDDDEDTSGVCPHCLNPPAPPLRDYYLHRSRKENR